MIHGLGQVTCRVCGIKESKSKIANAGLWLITFIFINLAWIIFRADSLQDAVKFFGQLITYKGLTVDETIVGAFQFPEFELVLSHVPMIGSSLLSWITAIATIICTVGIMVFKNTKQLTDKLTEPKWYQSAVSSVLLVWSIVSFAGVSTFLYWNF